MAYVLEELLKMALQKGASDLHLKPGVMPVIRRHGNLRPLAANLTPVTAEELEKMALGLMDERLKNQFNELHEVDLSFGLQGLGRFRVNIFRQRGSLRMVIRNIPHTVPSLDELHLPQILKKIADYERGLILVTGVTGSGKSSTLAAIVDHMNHHKNLHILTIEDPIEFLIRDRKSIITQREVGIDTTSYAKALRSALRQDPDVILIGEMRDPETIATALTAAETGHLVLSTLHTVDAVESINRVIGAFDQHQQEHVRRQLASVLKAVVSQRLGRKKDKSGFVPVVEVMINTPRIQELIEKKESTGEIRQAIEDGHQGWGMQSFDQSLLELLTAGEITFDEALSLSNTPEDLRVRYSGIDRMDNQNQFKEGSQYRKKVDQDWEGLSEIELDFPKEDLARKKKA